MAKAKKQVVTIEEIIAATNSEAGFMFAPAESLTEMLEAGQVEVDASTTNEQGWVAVRASAAAIPQVEMELEPATPAAEVAEVAPVVGIVIEEGLPIPPKAPRKVVSRSLKYPVDKLQVGQSFFIANKADDEGSAKRSLISCAHRYCQQNIIGQHTPEGKKVVQYEYSVGFDVREVTENGIAGARIWRVK